MALVSMIMPVYNRANTVRRAIESVLSQTHSDWELIIVDDGSSDGSAEITKSFTDQRIRLIGHSENRGYVAAINTALGECRGDYLSFVDSDDEALPDKLAVLLRALEQSESSIWVAVGGIEYDDGDRRNVVLPRIGRRAFPDLLRWRALISIHGVLIRRNAEVASLRFDPQLIHGPDWDFMLRIARNAEYLPVDTAVSRVYRVGADRMSTAKNSVAGRLQLVQKYAADLATDSEALSKHHEWIAIKYMMLRDRRNMLKHSRLATRARPGSPRLWLRVLAAHMGFKAFVATLKIVGG